VPPDFQKTVLQYVERWRSTPRLRKALDRARQRNLPRKIRLALDQYGLPREFMFLALQESDFDNTRVGPPTAFGFAKGMWQFIPQTAVEYGLTLGPYKDLPQYDPSDQRHDENRATQAAARYLAYLYSTKAAASGMLVIAAYNYGQTRIIQKLDQLPNDPRQRSFWYFYRNGWIPAETRDYVMSIFSAALICEKPDLFNFSMAPIDAIW
jgi:membrane-bound lytic murein transglycosylase D